MRHDAREALERLKALLLSVSFALAKEPPPPSRTDWTRLVPPPVLTGHVSRRRGGSGGVGTTVGARRRRVQAVDVVFVEKPRLRTKDDALHGQA